MATTQMNNENQQEKDINNQITTELVLAREFKQVTANRIFPSTILPKREKSEDVIHSVKRDGIQQPIIVRPHPTNSLDYEIIDGLNRFFGVVGESKGITFFSDKTCPTLLVDIRYGLTASDVFRIAYDTQIRKAPNTFERAARFVKWIETKAQEIGQMEGARTEVAKELVEIETSLDRKEDYQLFQNNVNSKRSLLSQYCKAYNVVTELEKKYENHDFDYLKTLSLNKLYALANLLDNLLVLKQIADRIEKHPEMSYETIKDLSTRGDRIIENKPTYALNVSISEEVGKSLHSKIYEKNKDIFLSSKSTKHILGDVVRQLVELFLIYPDRYVMELEKTKSKENRLKAIWHNME
jgi:hypothetical protein